MLIYTYISRYFVRTCQGGPPRSVPLSPMEWSGLTGMAGLRQEMAMQTPVYNHHKQKWVRSIGHTVHKIDVQRCSWIPWASVSLSVTHVPS